MSRDANSGPKVCFLLGLPRSGTTLLAHLLQQHPEITAPPEPWLMLALEAFGRVDHRHPAGTSLIETATSEFLGRIDRAAVSRAFADAAYGAYLSSAGKRIIVDKTPRYWMVLDYLDLLYPEAPHILLMRNPYAIAASLKSTWGVPLQAESSRSVSVSSLANLMLRVPDVITSSLADLVLGLPKLAAHRDRRQTMVVQYERLAACPDEEIQRLIAGLGCDPKDTASTSTARADYLHSSSFGDRKILERRTVDEKSVDAWQVQLGVEEMQTITDLIGVELMIQLGYGAELRHAQQAGVVDKGREVTELYRQIFRIWWDLRLSRERVWSNISADPGKLTHGIRQPIENSCSTPNASTGQDAQRLSGTDLDQNQELTSSMEAQLRMALLASESDRGAQQEAVRDRDAVIEALRGEIARLKEGSNNHER
ncbi:sulfotransferase [Bradyrhizobium elkanii]|uniref:Sulfotransferase n=1 Tax=Bradyrhizobium elkanii TaxID=29448 RepID=A0A4U6RHU6_BRAEL|nr:sulfotransferase [Bradyrhizobium elkanii]TKV73879.1 sulfotransferase [Bradyrhizobium elkanii]